MEQTIQRLVATKSCKKLELIILLLQRGLGMSNKRIFFKLEKVAESEVKLELDFERDDEKNIYIMGIASTPDKNSAGFIVENSALLESWKEVEEMNSKILVVLEVPKAGNERLLSVYEQGIYVGLSIGGWTLDGTWDEDNIFHVTEFEWYEVSLTDIPSNENALLLEYANTKKPIQENKLGANELETLLEKVTENIRGIK